LCASISTDTAIKIFDVLNYDLMLMLRLSFRPSCLEWIVKSGDVNPKIIICDSVTPQVFVYDVHESAEPIHVFSPHTTPVSLIKNNSVYDAVITMDSKGDSRHY